MFFIRTSMNYSESLANFMYASNISHSIQQRITIPLRNHIYSHSTSLDLSKYLFSLKTNISSGFQHTQTSFQQQQNGERFAVMNFSDNFSIALQSKLLSRIAIRYETHVEWSKTIINNEKDPLKKSGQISNQILTFDIGLSEKISLTIRNEYYHNIQVLQPSTSFYFSDASIRYKLPKPFTDIEFSCQNITNTDLFATAYTANNVLSTNSFRLRPRMWQLQLSFGF